VSVLTSKPLGRFLPIWPQNRWQRGALTAAVDSGQGDGRERANWGSGVAVEVKVERTSSVRARAGISPCPRGVAVETAGARASRGSGRNLKRAAWARLERC
jgi:hypothetical protein